MTKPIIDDRSPETKVAHKLRPTWETANPIAKAGLPPPPVRTEFDSVTDYREARLSWVARIPRILALREQALEKQ